MVSSEHTSHGGGSYGDVEAFLRAGHGLLGNSVTGQSVFIKNMLPFPFVKARGASECLPKAESSFWSYLTPAFGCSSICSTYIF